ncbi:MAG: helix-turn-helix transcriptional regulator [Clostridia bacterium]|nr:helix-turn-helix transcriptional regulator [Clostridia bacterium]
MKVKDVPQWGIEVKKTLLDRRMTVDQLATELNMSRPYINNIINGKFIIPKTQERICKHLGIPSE